MKAIVYETGQFVNGLKFIKEIAPRVSASRRSRMALFECYCGKLFEVLIGSVISGNTTSCGCWGAKSRSIRFKKHGLRGHDIYKVWCGIKTRCYNKNRIDYKYYGAIGIVLSQEFHDFEVFLKYVSSLPLYHKRKELKLTIDRINVKENYERGNLRWATRKEQSLNQRRNSRS
jgi:hypothetical protein